VMKIISHIALLSMIIGHNAQIKACNKLILLYKTQKAY